MRTADVYQSPDLAGLVTDDGLPLPGIRQPYNQPQLVASRASFWQEQARIYQGKLRQGLGLLDPRPAHTRDTSGEDTGDPFDEIGAGADGIRLADDTGDVNYNGLANAGLSLGEGALARTGGAGAAAATGAKIGGSIGGTVGVATGTTLAALGIFGATTAAFSAVPVIGTVVGAVVGAAAALSYYLGKDTFRPSPLEATEWLALWRADPGLLFAGVDKLTVRSGSRKHPAEELAVRLVRYFKQVAGEVPMHGPLYNPVTNLSCKNPYMCRVDPADPLTDPAYLRTVREAVAAHRLAPPEVTTPEQAAAVLRVLRAGLVRKGSVLGWSEVQKNLPGLRREVSYLRSLAGETGPEPVLGKLLGGELLSGRVRGALAAPIAPTDRFLTLRRPT